MVVLSLMMVPPQESSDAPPDADQGWRIGVFFWHHSPNDIAALVGIQTALAETGRPHELLVRQADSDEAKSSGILDEFESEAVDLIFVMGTDAALRAAARISVIPVVFTAVTNPVESGIVPSWNGSQRNVAGNSNWLGPETVLHVFTLAVPGIKRLGILRSKTTGVVSEAELRGMRDYLARLDAPPVEIIEEIINGSDDLQPAVERLVASGVQAIWIPIDYDVYVNIDVILRTVKPHKLPLVSSSLRVAKAGAVAGILVDYEILGQRAVVIALDILEGQTPPGTIPVGTMNGYQVVVNLHAARRCDYELPLSLLALADFILEDGGPGGGQ